MKLGIIQGRLLPPVEEFVQEFPLYWKLEFKYARKIGLNHIEWIVTSDSFSTNPIFGESFKFKDSDPKISSLCADFLVDIPDYFVWDDEGFSVANIAASLRKLCDAAVNWGVPCITLPLLEGADWSNHDTRSWLWPVILDVAGYYPKLTFSLEIDSIGPQSMLMFLGQRPNLALTYDTGNIQENAPCNHKEYLKRPELVAFINNVHLKDKNHIGMSVRPGEGTVPFDKIFELLKGAGYDGLYTMQFARDMADEVVTAQEDMSFVLEEGNVLC